MKLILRRPVSNLGEEGDVVTVRPGYGRNYLVPQGLAFPATELHLARLEEERAQREARDRRDRLEAQRRAALLESLRLKFLERAGKEGRLFGSVTAADIVARVEDAELGFDLDRRLIQLDEPLKQLGVHGVTVRLHPEVTVDLQVTVEPIDF